MKFLLFSIIILMIACTNPVANKQEEIKKSFDSVNRSLQSLSAKIDTSTRVNDYTLVAIKFAGSKNLEMIQGMRKQVNEFNATIDDIKKKFLIACRDPTGTILPEKSEEDTSLTNNFFIKKKESDRILISLAPLVLSFSANSMISQSVIKDDELVRIDRDKLFSDMYFKNIPPVAALTILNSFEANVNTVEKRILNDYLKSSNQLNQ